MKRTNIKPGRLIAFTAIFFVLFSGCEGKLLLASDIRSMTSAQGSFNNITVPIQNSSPVLTLQTAISLALERNPDLQAARARIIRSEAILKEARSAFLPAVSAFAEYMQGDSPSTFLFKTIDQRALAPGTDFNSPGWFENYEAGIKATVNLFSGGGDLYRNKIAQEGIAVSQAERLEMENSIVSAMVEAYYSALAAKNYGAVARESISTVENELRLARVRYEAGSTLKSDVLSLEVRLARAREEYLAAENALQLALAGLKNIISIAQSEEIFPDESCTLPEDIPSAYEPGLAFALEHRPELQKLKQEISRAELRLKAAMAAYFPKVDLQAKYYYDSPDMDFDTDLENWSAAILLNWDIFDGGRRQAGVRKARAAMEELKALEKKAASAVEFEVKRAFLRFRDAEERLKVAVTGLTHAQESLRLVKIQYEGGSANVTRYLEAELDRNRAGLRKATAYYDREKALAEAARATGFWAVYSRKGWEDGKTSRQDP